MKILLLTTHLNIGGIGTYVVSLAEGLKGAGHEVAVASSGYQLVQRLQREGIRHFDVDIRTKSEFSPKVFSAVKKLSTLIKEFKPDIIHSQTRVTQFAGEMLSAITKVPLVTTAHGFFKPHIFRRKFGCWGRKVIAISEGVRRHLIEDMGVEEHRIAVVHNGIDIGAFAKVPEPWKEEFRRNAGLKSSGPVIGIIGRLSDVKGHRFLIMAMEEILKAFPDAVLLIVGEGREYGYLIDLVQRMGIGKSVRFLNSVFDTRLPLSVMELFVMPSINEGLGLAIMEAMAYGVPVAAADIPGIRTLIDNGNTGLLVEPQNPSAIAEGVIKLLEDKELKNGIAERASGFIKEEFSLEKMVDGTMEVYREVCG